MILDIVTFPEEFLRQKAKPVEEINQEIIELAQNMIETMHDAPGVGLAAPQIGKSIRMIVADEHPRDIKSNPIILINPEIIEGEGELFEEEGCLSLPGEYAYVKRYQKIKVKYTSLINQEVIIEAEDTLSRILQHEIDHLDGKLFIDKLSMMKRETIKKHIKRRIQEGDYTVVKPK